MMKRLMVGLVSTLAIAGAGQAATPEPYSMRGVDLGITLAEFKAITPPEQEGVTGGVKTVGSQAACTAGVTKTTCQWEGFLADDRYKRVRSPIFNELGDGGGYAEFEFAPAPDGQQRLVRINVQSNMQYLNGMLPAFMTKYGKPDSQTTPVQNGFGAKYASETMTWSNRVSTIVMETRCGEAQFLCVTYTHTGLATASEEATRRANGDPASRL